jgi:hypothetical protein
MTTLLILYFVFWTGIMLWSFKLSADKFWDILGDYYLACGYAFALLIAWWTLPLLVHVLNIKETLTDAPWYRAVRLSSSCMAFVVAWRTQPFSSAIGMGVFLLMNVVFILFMIGMYIWDGSNHLPDYLESLKFLKK